MAVAASEIRADVLQNGVARILLEAVMKLASLTGSPPLRFPLPLELFDQDFWVQSKNEDNFFVIVSKMSM